jgi:hypothetical protein
MFRHNVKVVLLGILEQGLWALLIVTLLIGPTGIMIDVPAHPVVAHMNIEPIHAPESQWAMPYWMWKIYQYVCKPIGAKANICG